MRWQGELGAAFCNGHHPWFSCVWMVVCRITYRGAQCKPELWHLQVHEAEVHDVNKKKKKAKANFVLQPTPAKGHGKGKAAVQPQPINKVCCCVMFPHGFRNSTDPDLPTSTCMRCMLRRRATTLPPADPTQSHVQV